MWVTMQRFLRTVIAVPAAMCMAHAQAPWTRGQMAADLDEIAAAVRAKWAYFDDRRANSAVDVDALRDAAKADLPGVQSIDDFACILRRFAAGLQDGHAWASVPGASPPPARRLPFRLLDCVEGLVVAVVAAGPERPRVGDLLVDLDGIAVEDRLAAHARECCASTPGMLRAMAVDRLQNTAAERVACTFADADGKRLSVTVTTLVGDEPLRERKPANWSLAWPRPGVAELHLSSFVVPRWNEWLAARPEDREPFLAEGRARIDAIIAELAEKKATTLILDLRGNVGGTDALGIHLAERLLAGPFRYFQLSSQSDGIWSKPGGLPYGQGGHARFLGKVVALVDSGTVSTTDNFVRCLRDLHPRLTVVGRPSGGGTGAPRQLVEATHSKAVLGACTMRVLGPKGTLAEGRGTIPDVAVRWTRADVIGGRDPDLEAAFAAAAK
jgi:C-terminal processing protease CtpA/Prc